VSRAVAEQERSPLIGRTIGSTLAASRVWERRYFGLPALFDLALLTLATTLWFVPVPWLIAGFPALALYWWRRRCAAAAPASTELNLPTYLLLGLGVLALIPSGDIQVSLSRLLGLWLGIALFHAVSDLLVTEK
jgi:hypothetical protein